MALPASKANRGAIRPSAAKGKWAWVILWIGFLSNALGQGPSGLLSEEIFSANSHSRQFLVQANRLHLGSPALSTYATNAGYIRLDPMIVPVSCERIKQVVWRELGTTAPWQGKISIYIQPARSLDEMVQIEALSFRDGWRYRVLLPEILPRVRYVRAIVKVVLMEIANRLPGRKGPEIPAWVIEGMAQQVLSSSEITVILPPPNMQTNRVGAVPVMLDQRRPKQLEQAHRVLSEGKVMTFEELSWQVFSPLAEDERFRLNSQVFVQRLIQLPNGRQSLLKFLEALPRFQNWQFAFLEAFAPTFSRPLDVEKWWALEVQQFLNRDLGQTWSEELTWQRLEDALRSEVAVYASTNEAPKETELPLATILADWEPAHQVPLLQAKLASLAYVRVRSAPSVVTVVDEYQAILRDYLSMIDIGDKAWTKRRKAAQAEASQVARNRLSDLENRVKAARPNRNPALGAQLEALRVSATNAPSQLRD